MNKKLFSILIIAILGFSIFTYLSKKANIKPLKVSKCDYIEKIKASGTIEGKENIFLSSEISGVIEIIFVNEGDYVEQGALIAKFNTDQIEAEIERADSYETQETLKNSLRKHYIYAPYNGYVTAKYVEINEPVVPSKKLFKLTSSEDKVVEFNIDEKYINKISLDCPIKIYPFNKTKIYSTGKIYFIEFDPSTNNTAIKVKGTIDNKFDEFLYGSAVNIVIDGKKIIDGILIPKEYVVSKNNKNYIFVELEGKIQPVEVLGEFVIDGFIVTEGLQNEDIILIPSTIDF